MEVVRSKGEVVRIILSERVVVVAFVDPQSKMGRHVMEVFSSLEKVSKNRVKYVVYPVNEVGDENRVNITLYVDGEPVLEQEECFGDVTLDYNALKLGIRDALSSRRIEPPF